MQNKIVYFYRFLATLGLKWLTFRLSYEARRRLGFLRRQLPGKEWHACPLSHYLNDSTLANPSTYFDYRLKKAPPFFFSWSQRNDYSSRFPQWDSESASPTAYAAGVDQGLFIFFEHQRIQTSFPPQWHTNPFTGQNIPSGKHWTEIDDFACGDIKMIWELSRFAFVYALVRAFWRTGDQKYAETFWHLVEDWREKNPPNWGANWKCGQEVAFRVMAWCFGLYGFFRADSTNAHRMTALSQMISVSGERIEGNIRYALNQRNNHGISEAVGLLTIGLLFPEFRKATSWREMGKRLLEEQGKSLIYEDGAFSQHSFNYQRLMLHDYLWALRLGDLNGHGFSDQLKARVRKSADFIHQLQDAATGQVPNYGQNDGALVLPLNNCGPVDFRPVVQAANYYFTGKRCFEAGSWDEDLLWLYGADSLLAPVVAKPRYDLQATQGGYYTLRSETGFVFVRCATLRDRPSQADMLHVDLWLRGKNLALDPGTYSYNAPQPWNNPLAHTTFHNTVTVDGRDQMDRIGRFLWFPWLKGTLRCMQRSTTGLSSYWEGSHDGYRRLSSPVSHRRGILQLNREGWLIMDCLSSSKHHRYRLHWLFPDLEHHWNEGQGLLSIATDAGPYHIRTQNLHRKGCYSLVRGHENSPRGWRAPGYSCREPALSLDLTVEAREVLFWTLFSFDPCDVTRMGDCMTLEALSWHGAVSMQPAAEPFLIKNFSFHGIQEDRLDLH